jgi:hypothetical protein
VLAPALSPEDIVVMDNLAAHKVKGVREAIEARGTCLLYLPPYPPASAVKTPAARPAPDATVCKDAKFNSDGVIPLMVAVVGAKLVFEISKCARVLDAVLLVKRTDRLRGYEGSSIGDFLATRRC